MLSYQTLYLNFSCRTPDLMGVVEEGLVVVAFSLVAPVIFLSIFIDSHFISISIYCRCDHKFAIHLTIPGEAMPVAYYPH